METMLIIGGAGFIGNALVNFYKDKFFIDVLDQDEYYNLDINNIFRVNLCRDSMEYLGDDYSYIINCASVLGIERVINYPLYTLESNVKMASKVMELVKRQKKLKKYIYLSTSEVYGRESESATEIQDLIIGPPNEERWSYSLSKLYAEHYLFHFCKQNSISGIVVRPFNVYGVGREKDGAVNRLVYDALVDGQVTITGTGNQKRAWCEISDFVSGFDCVLKYGASMEIYNIGNPNEYKSINNIIEIIKKITSKKLILIKTVLNQDIINRYPDITKIQKLGYKPKISVEKGIKKMILDLGGK